MEKRAFPVLHLLGSDEATKTKLLNGFCDLLLWVKFMNFSIEPNDFFILLVPKIPFLAKQYVRCLAYHRNSFCSIPNACYIRHIQPVEMSAVPMLCFKYWLLSSSLQFYSLLRFRGETEFFHSPRSVWGHPRALTAGAKFAESKAFGLWFENVCFCSLFCCLTQRRSHPLPLLSSKTDASSGTLGPIASVA